MILKGIIDFNQNYTMKNIKLAGLLAFGLLLSLGVANAQTASTEKEHHNKLSENHKKGKEHANAIVSGQSKTKKEHKKHAAEAGKNLNEAKEHHAAIKKSHKGKNAESHEAIEKNHADADMHLKSLNEELNKPNPDDKKVKEHAKNHHDAIDKAHQEHEKLKKKG